MQLYGRATASKNRQLVSLEGIALQSLRQARSRGAGAGEGDPVPQGARGCHPGSAGRREARRFRRS